jgi:hypothetical protein
MNHPNFIRIRFGALLLALSLVGYAIYELILLPAAGFPSDDMRIIIGGADTLRIGHWLKFGYGLAIALVVVGMTMHLREASPALTQLALMAGIASVALYIASGMLGLRILDYAQNFYAANNLADARSTILIRSVTQSLQAAGTFAAGWFALLIPIFILPYPLWLIGPLLMIAYAIALAIVPMHK